MVVIDQENCIGCGVCVLNCVSKVISLKENTAKTKGNCIQCGHCVAVCPVKAISIPEYDMDDVEEYKRGTFEIDPAIFLHAVKFRRSVRSFISKPVERDKMNRILQAGRYTATAKNRQSVTFTVVKKNLEEFKEQFWKALPEIIQEIDKTSREMARAYELFLKRRQRKAADDGLFFDATVLLIISCEDVLDGGLASANIENMAVAEGVGVLYSGFIRRAIEMSQTLREWLGINEKIVVSCMVMGYPNVHYKRTAPRKKADIVWK